MVVGLGDRRFPKLAEISRPLYWGEREAVGAFLVAVMVDLGLDVAKVSKLSATAYSTI